MVGKKDFIADNRNEPTREQYDQVLKELDEKIKEIGKQYKVDIDKDPWKELAEKPKNINIMDQFEAQLVYDEEGRVDPFKSTVVKKPNELTQPRLQTPPIFKFALREDLKEDKKFLPTRAEPTATGWDVRAAMKDKQPLIVKPFDYVKIPLGFRAFCPEGWWYKLCPRSSSFAKKSLHALYGIIDEQYENEAVFSAQYIPKLNIVRRDNTSAAWIFGYPMAEELKIEFGEAIGQIIPVRRKEMAVEEVSNEEYDELCRNRGGVRGTGGFGSTSK